MCWLGYSFIQFLMFLYSIIRLPPLNLKCVWYFVDGIFLFFFLLDCWTLIGKTRFPDTRHVRLASNPYHDQWSFYTPAINIWWQSVVSDLYPVHICYNWPTRRNDPKTSYQCSRCGGAYSSCWLPLQAYVESLCMLLGFPGFCLVFSYNII